MNLEKNLILVKGEDKTDSIASCRYNNNEKKYEICFNGSVKSYPYGENAVEWLREPIEIDHAKNKFYAEGKPLFAIAKVLRFKDYIRVFFEKGFSVLYMPGKLKILSSCLEEQKSKNLFSYFSGLAEIMPAAEDSDKSHLSHQFEKIGFVGSDTVLAKYLNPDRQNDMSRPVPPLIFPFGCNESQRNAVKMALSNTVSVIEGPPGTGKTQTILNIIANLLLEGKSAAVVSNNNSATANVYEKLQKYGLDFLCARLGKKDNKEEFLAHQPVVNTGLPVMEEEELLEGRREADRIQSELAKKLAMRNELAQLTQQLKALALEEEYFTSFYEETYLKSMEITLRKAIPSRRLLYLWSEYETIQEKKRNPRLTVWQKFKYAYWYGIGNYHFYGGVQENIIPVFQGLYYRSKRMELENRKKEIEQELLKTDFQGMAKQLTDLSMKILLGTVSKRYREHVRMIFTGEDLWKNTGEILQQYPVVLSTTHSIRSSLPGAVYDYIIVDEASQVDLVTGFLTMSCTKNLVVVGDEKQLPNVVPDELKKRAAAIAKGYQVPEAMRYENNSLLSSIKKAVPAAPAVILREHYRCHPKIIQFCNQKFYHNELVIMSEDKGEEDVLRVYKTVPGNHARRTVNLRQIEEIRQNVLPELVQSEAEEDIGIISPYRAQTEKMDEIFHESEIAIDTVHKFQGREKEAVIITTVDNEISPFTDNPNMLNVAVSRAKKKLRLVVSDHEANDKTNIGDLIRYVAYQKGEVREGKVYSVFDLLYQDYKDARDEFLASHKRVSAYDSENLMYGTVMDLLKEKRLDSMSVAVHVSLRELLRSLKLLSEEEIRYVMHPSTHVDLVIFRNVDKSPVLVIEVDGSRYHRKGTFQHDVRDAMKDRILEKFEIPFLRLNTAGSGEKEKIAGMLGV